MNKMRANLGFSKALDDFSPEEWSTKKNITEETLIMDKSEEEKKLIRSQAATQAAIFSGFQSREPNASLQKTQKDKKLLRRRRTGRNAQFNLKTCPETITAFCHIADQQGWGLGETFEKAVALLELEYLQK